jgi:hypothetical protein
MSIECLTAPSARPVSDPGAQPLGLGLEIGAFAAGRGQRGFLERDPEPLRAFAGASGATFAGGLVVSGAAARPAGEVPGGREHGHVDADFSDHHLSGAAGDAGEGAGELDARGERAELLLDRFGEPGDLLLEEIEVGEDRADHRRVMGLKAARQRLAQRRDLRAQLPFREVGQHLGIGGALNERVEHRPARSAEKCRWRRNRA